MFNYDIVKMQVLMENIIMAHCSQEAGQWLQLNIKTPADTAHFNTSFALIPRKTGKLVVVPTHEQTELLQQIAGYGC
jgi:hypothetical protein